MRANKIIIDLFSTPYHQSDLTKEEYKEFYERNDTVYIVLRSDKIYTKLNRSKMFDMNLHHGCFIEHDSQCTPEEVRKTALGYVEKEGLAYVEPEEFQRIEKQGERERVKKAFIIAETMIASN